MNQSGKDSLQGQEVREVRKTKQDILFGNSAIASIFKVGGPVLFNNY